MFTKNEKFEWMFLLSAIVIWLGVGKTAWSCILLMLASAYMLCNVIAELKRN